MKRTAAALALLLLALLFSSIWLNARRGVPLDGKFFVQKNTFTFRAGRDNIIVLSRDSESSTAIELLLRGEASTAHLTWSASAACVEYENGETIQGRWNGEHLTDDNGIPLSFRDGVSITVNGKPAPIGRYALADALCRMDSGATESSGSISLTLVGALIYLLGAFQFLWPEKAFFLCSRWMYAQAELSEEGRLFTRLGGIAILLCAAAAMLGPLFF